MRSYEHAQGSLLVHVTTRSGPRPHALATFATNDHGIGIWLLPAPEGTELYLGATGDEAELAAGGGLLGVRRDRGQYPLHGVRGTLKSNATHLSTELVVLGSSSILQSYDAGVCLEDAARYPELHRVAFEFDADRSALRVRRQPGGVEPALELLLVGVDGTHIELRERHESPRSTCPLAPGTGQPIIALSNDTGIAIDFIALTTEATSGSDEGR